MGGFGSGRYCYRARYDVEDCVSFDLKCLKKKGIKIIPDVWHMFTVHGLFGSPVNVDLKFPKRGDPIIELASRGVANKLSLLAKPQPFGGVRWWFECPILKKPCRMVFLPPRQAMFASRQA